MSPGVVIGIVGLRTQRLELRQPFLDTGTLRRNWRLYASFLLRHLGAFSIWTISPLYISELGASRFWVAAIWAINPLGQFLFMHLLESTAERFLIRTGLLPSTAVFIALGLATDWRQLILIQTALALLVVSVPGFT